MSIVPTPDLDTWVASNLGIVDMFNANVRDVQKFLAYAPLTILTRTAVQNVAASTSTLVSWDTEIIDVDNMITVPSTDLVCQRAGLYCIQFVNNFVTSNAGDQRAASIKVNGASVAQQVDFRAVNVGTLNNCSALVALNVGDVIQASVFQDTTGNLNIGGNFNAPRIAVRLVSTANLTIDYGTGLTSNPTPPPSKPPTSGTPTSHTNTYPALWSRTFDGDLGITWDDSAHCYQGFYSTDRGNSRSLVGFDYATIQSDLAGATNIHVKVSFKVAHAYFASGVTAVVGTHDYSAKPSTWADSSVNQDIVRRGGCEKDSRYTVDFGLNTDASNSFQSWAKGVAFGPGPSQGSQYYGYMYGATEGGKPVLTISFTK